MTIGNPQFERAFEAFLHGDDARLEALYRKLPQSEPDSQLDAAVRALAQRAVAATARPPDATHRRWLPVFSVAAAVALAVGFAFRLGPQLWQRPAVPPEAENAAAPAAPPATPAPGALKDESAPAAKAPSTAPAPPVQMQKVENTTSRPASRAFPAPAQALREPPPPPAAAEVKPAQPAPAMAARAKAMQSDAASAGAPAPALAAPAEQDRNATLYPEHWLANIRQMLRENQREAALRSLEKFRKTYPDYRLPDDLRDLH